jgi:hypothetical protein
MRHAGTEVRLTGAGAAHFNTAQGWVGGRTALEQGFARRA